MHAITCRLTVEYGISFGLQHSTYEYGTYLYCMYYLVRLKSEWYVETYSLTLYCMGYFCATLPTFAVSLIVLLLLFHYLSSNQCLNTSKAQTAQLLLCIEICIYY